jgi:hypothetical protein
MIDIYNLKIDKKNFAFKLLEQNKNIKHFTGSLENISFILPNLVVITFLDNRNKYSNNDIKYKLELNIDEKVNIQYLNLLISSIYKPIFNINNLTSIVTQKQENNDLKLSYIIKSNDLFVDTIINLSHLITMIKDENRLNDIIIICNNKINEQKGKNKWNF